MENLNIIFEFGLLNISKSPHGSKGKKNIMFILGLLPSLCQAEVHIIMNEVRDQSPYLKFFGTREISADFAPEFYYHTGFVALHYLRK